MHAETTLTQEDAPRSHWIKIASVTYKPTESTSRFFYIGNTDESIASLSSQFLSGTVVESFADAKKMLEQNTEPVPMDVIFIDLPFIKIDLITFCSYLKSRDLIFKTPLIYNERKLDFNNIKVLRNLQLIDDVVDLTSEAVDYGNKISFIRKIKSRAALKSPAAPKLSLYGITADQVRHYAARQIKTGKKILSAKRLLDIALATIALLILSPIFLLIAISVKISSKGPVFYKSLRAGQGFRIFEFYKFRTMELGADKKVDALAHLNQYSSSESGPLFFKVTNDPRITRFGKFLRKTSMDELPQLINVIKGDMSLVGNRPLPLYEAATLTTNEFVERFMAPAGMTGLWQVRKRGRSNMSIEERINLDILYARRANLIYDLRIMVSTPAALWQKTDV